MVGLRPWRPDLESFLKVLRFCPRLDTMRLLLDDKDLSVMAEALVAHPEDVEVEDLEVHCCCLSSTSFAATGIDLLAIGVGQYLTTLTLTLLDSYTWSFLKGKTFGIRFNFPKNENERISVTTFLKFTIKRGGSNSRGSHHKAKANTQ